MQKTEDGKDYLSQDHRRLVNAEELLEHARELKAEPNARTSEIITKFEKLHEKVQKIAQEKNSLEMELKFKEREYKLLTAMQEKDIDNQFLQKKLNKKKEKIKRLKEQLHRKECEFHSAHHEAQALRRELSLAQLELEKKHEELIQLQ